MVAPQAPRLRVTLRAALASVDKIDAPGLDL